MADKELEVMLNTKEAYLAMLEFLIAYYEMTHWDDLGALLGSMDLLEDGMPADSAIWHDWIRSIEKVRQR